MRDDPIGIDIETVHLNRYILNVFSKHLQAKCDTEPHFGSCGVSIPPSEMGSMTVCDTSGFVTPKIYR